LALALIGEQFEVTEDICGIQVSNRFSEDLILVWNRSAQNEEVKQCIHDRLRRLLISTPNVTLEYKAHQEVLKYHTKTVSMGPT